MAKGGLLYYQIDQLDAENICGATCVTLLGGASYLDVKHPATSVDFPYLPKKLNIHIVLLTADLR